MPLNKDQQRAVDSRKGNFLVSAGAGSGKTQVLTTRIKDIVKSGDAKVNELLVLTFTNKAAAEMKKRTRSALLKEMPEAAEEVETSDITTFDSFFLKLVKKYAYRLGVSTDISIVDSSFIALKENEIIDELLTEVLTRGDELSNELVRQFVLKNDENLSNCVKAILSEASKTTSPEEFFESLKKDYFSDEYLKARKEEYFQKCKKKIDDAIELNSYGAFETYALDREVLYYWQGLKDYDDLYERVAKIKNKVGETVSLNGNAYSVSFPRKKKGDDFSSEDSLYREIYKDIIKEDIIGKISTLGDPNKQIENIKNTQQFVVILVEIAEKTYQKLNEYKKEMNAYTFSDIASLARSLLDDEKIRESIKNKYKYIMVDEYQDTSDLQEEFITRIANDNLFLVGDIKQSIYRFRNANPDIFGKKLSDYSSHKGGELIPLQTNYRSRKEVIDFVNGIFSKTMSPSLGEVDYSDPAQSLLFGNDKLYGSEEKKEFKAKLIRYELRDDLDKKEAEAKTIAKDILEKVGNKLPLDVKDEGTRPAKWKDFAILIPNKKDFGIYKKVFSELSIPLSVKMEEDFGDDTLNLLFMNILRMPLAIDCDEIQTKHCYVSIKRSYLFSEDDDLLIDEIQNGTYLNDSLVQEMRKDKERLLKMGVYEAASYLIEKYQMVDKLIYIGDVKDNFEKISHILDNALAADRMGLDYQSYVDHYDSLKKHKVDDALELDPVEGNQVKLMTIHASKGLEFPIVYLPNLKRRVHESNGKEKYIVSKDYGILLPKNRSDDTSTNFLYELYRDHTNSKGLSEYMRLFYVALTRACSQIVFVAPLDKEEETYTRITLSKTGNTYFGRIAPEIGSRKIISFMDFINLSGGPFIRGNINTEIIKEEMFLVAAGGEQSSIDKPELRSIRIAPEIYESHRASKTSLEPADDASLFEGTRLHRLLELTSFKAKDDSFITDQKDKEIVDKILSNSLFDNLNGYNEYHEYSYFDEENNVHGIIDLLLVKKDEEAVIIDFKTLHIDDPDYKKQLDTYKSYVERVFNIKAKTYLLSILKGEIKRVE